MHAVRQPLRRPVEAQLHQLGRLIDAFQIDDVVDRLGGVDVLSIGGGKCRPVAALERAGLCLLETCAECRAQPVAPGHQRLGDLALELARRARAARWSGRPVPRTCSCASGASPIVRLASSSLPCSAVRSSASMRACASLSQRSRGRYTRHDQKRWNSSRRRISRTRARSCSASTARAQSGSGPGRWPGTVHRAAGSAGSAAGVCHRGCWAQTESAR